MGGQGRATAGKLCETRRGGLGFGLRTAFSIKQLYQLIKRGIWSICCDFLASGVLLVARKHCSDVGVLCVNPENFLNFG